MGMPWFRLYSEFAFDPQIQSMDETSQRRFVIVLCLMCDGCLPKLSDEEIACAMRIPIDDLRQTKELFIKKGFINENWDVLKWDKRQYKSDSSTDRTKKWRKNKKNVTETSQKRHRNSGVTPPDTDTDTDTDNKKKNNIKRKKQIPLDFYVNESMSKWFDNQNFKNININKETEKFIDHWKSKGEAKKDWTAAWRNWMRNAEEWSRGKQNKFIGDAMMDKNLTAAKEFIEDESIG